MGEKMQINLLELKMTIQELRNLNTVMRVKRARELLDKASEIVDKLLSGVEYEQDDFEEDSLQ